MSEIAKGGCTTLLVIFVIVALFMRPLIPMGFVIGLTGIMLSLCWYASNTKHRATAATILQASISLAFLSTMGIIFLDTSAPEDSDHDERIADGIIPAEYQGRWSSDGDCSNYYATITVDEDSVNFAGGTHFSADSANKTDNGITLIGGTIAVAAKLSDSTYQKETATLSVSSDGKSLLINGEPSQRCEE